MASRKALLITAAMAVVVVVGTLLPATASAAVYKVGDDSGWDLGVDYNAWAFGKNFQVGDTLHFVYSTPAHNVVMVGDASYQACVVPIFNAPPPMTSGDDRVTLGQAGRWNFICGIEGNCGSGMKLAVYVQ